MPPTDKALAVMTLPKMTRFHHDAITIAVLEEQANDESPPRWLSDIQSVVRYLVEHPERLAGEDEVVVNKKEMETTAASLARLADGVRQDTVVFSRLYDLFNRWLAGSPTAQEGKESE